MRAYVGVGTNLGDRWAHLARAARELRATAGVTLIRASGVYENEAVGPGSQGRYLNAVLELETVLRPGELLRALVDIERAALRLRSVRWGPRTLDLDLLLYGDQVVHTADLTIPHPRLASRRFVLAPLAELCPDREIPGTQLTVAETLTVAPPHDVTLVGRYPIR